MHHERFDSGRFRIYTAAMEASDGEGFLAAVIVKRVRGPGPTLDVYRNDESRRVWPSARAALDAAHGEGLCALERLELSLTYC